MTPQGTPLETETFVIANGQTTSAAVAIKDPASIGLLVPTVTSGTLKVQVSADGANFFDLQDASANVLLSYVTTTGGFALSSVDLSHVLGYGWLRVVSGASQGADRTFTLVRTLVRTDPLA